MNLYQCTGSYSYLVIKNLRYTYCNNLRDLSTRKLYPIKKFASTEELFIKYLQNAEDRGVTFIRSYASLEELLSQPELLI